MIASWSPAPARPAPAQASPPGTGAGIGGGAEAAFRDALVESLERLELGDRNWLRFHYVHGVGVDRLAAMFSRRRAAVRRRLGRIRARLLRDVRRGLAARLALDRRALDELLDLARARLDLAIARVLRAR